MSSDIIKEILPTFKERIREAENIAKQLGEVIGIVSPFESTFSGAEGKVKILLDIPKYLEFKRRIARPGTILAIVDIATLEVISVKITEWTRADYYSQYGRESELIPYPIVPDERGLITRPQAVAEPLLAFRLEGDKLVGGTIADYVIEPRSPVVLPKPEYLEVLSGIKGDVTLGALTIGEEIVEVGDKVAKVKIPLSDMLYHTFVVGTTGSGKTSFLKNLIRSLLVKYANEREDQGSKVAIVCIDDNGDYVQTIFDPIWDISEDEKKIEEKLARELYAGIGGLEKIIVLLPVTRYFIEKYNVNSLEKLAKIYYEAFLSKLIKYSKENEKEIKVEFSEEENAGMITLKLGNAERIIKVIPYALKFSNIKDKLAEFYPFFTALAREGISAVFRYLDENNKKEVIVPISRRRGDTKRYPIKVDETFVSYLRCIDDLCDLNQYWFSDQVKVHSRTLESIHRGLTRLHEMGIFDVKIGNNIIEEPEVEKFVEGGALSVLDLHALETEVGVASKAKRILTLRILRRILEWKMSKEFEETPITLILVDEAHKYFPRSAEGEKEYIEYISSALERIARLGRVRGLGLILSTHSPKDVHSTVLNLCNTKIIFRLDPSVIGDLDLPKEYKDFVTKASDRVGVMKSHALRLHYVTFKTTLPTLGHFKR